MSNQNTINEHSSVEECLIEGFRCLKIAANKLGINLLDNYGYREYTATEQLKELLPSIKKKIGRTGDDATAIDEDYHHIEQKSGSNKAKTLTMSCFPDMMFDKQGDPVRRDYIFNYDGLSVSYFEYFQPFPTAVVFVPREHIPKLHPLLRQRQTEKMMQFEQRKAEGKNIGHDAIKVSIADLLQYVGKKNLVCWLHRTRIDSEEFFNKIEQGQIKINQ